MALHVAPCGIHVAPRGVHVAPCGIHVAPHGRSSRGRIPRGPPTGSPRPPGGSGGSRAPKCTLGAQGALLRSQNAILIVPLPSPIGVSPFGGPGAPEVLQSALLRTFALLGSQNHQISITFYLPRALGSLWSAKVLQSDFWATWSVLTAPTVKFHWCFTFPKSNWKFDEIPYLKTFKSSKSHFHFGR